MTRPEYWIGSAAQGGFSSLSLPAAGFCSPAVAPYVIHWTSGGIACTNQSSAVLTDPAPLQVANGPMGVPALGWSGFSGSGEASYGLATGFFPPSGPITTWTMAAWGKANGNVPASTGYLLIEDQTTNLFVRYELFWGHDTGVRTTKIVNLSEYDIQTEFATGTSDWTYLSVGSDGTNIRAFMDGALIFAYPATSLAVSSLAFKLGGATGADHSLAFNQALFHPTECLYTGSYTPPTEPFYYRSDL